MKYNIDQAMMDAVLASSFSYGININPTLPSNCMSSTQIWIEKCAHTDIDDIHEFWNDAINEYRILNETYCLEVLTSLDYYDIDDNSPRKIAFKGFISSYDVKTRMLRFGISVSKRLFQEQVLANWKKCFPEKIFVNEMDLYEYFIQETLPIEECMKCDTINKSIQIPVESIKLIRLHASV